MPVHYLPLPKDAHEAHRIVSEHVARYFPGRISLVTYAGTWAWTPRELVDSVIQDKGFSVHDYVGDAKHTGFMVALPGSEERYALQEIEAEPEIFTAYADAHAGLLEQPDNYFGAWLSSGWVVLDVSIYEPVLRVAMRLGLAYKQEAIYDLGAGKSLRVADYHPDSLTAGLVASRGGRVYARNMTTVRDQVLGHLGPRSPDYQKITFKTEDGKRKTVFLKVISDGPMLLMGQLLDNTGSISGFYNKEGTEVRTQHVIEKSLITKRVTMRQTLTYATWVPDPDSSPR